jgi:hypothetical protein
LPIVYQLTLDAALKFHGKSQIPASKVQEMWRHITGVEQPAKKIKLDNNEKLERKGRMIRSKEKENFKQAGRKTATGITTDMEYWPLFIVYCTWYPWYIEHDL